MTQGLGWSSRSSTAASCVSCIKMFRVGRSYFKAAVFDVLFSKTLFVVIFFWCLFWRIGGVECHDVPLSFCCWPNLGQWWANDSTVKCDGISAKEVVAFRIPALGSSTRQERQVVRMGRVLFVDLRNHTCTRPVDKTKDGWIPKLNMRVKHCGEIIQLKIRTVLMLMITWLTCLDIPPLILYDHVAAQCLVQYLCEDLVYWVYFKDL